MDRLGLDYLCISPDINETAQGETHADNLAKRLAFEKASIIAQQHPNAITIGSDQVAWRITEPQKFLGKPYTQEGAILQLTQNSGQRVCFSTALSVQVPAIAFETTIVEHYEVKFRTLTQHEIRRYIKKEQPFGCAGSFKCEALGISLFESMHGHDQTSLMGLPMIQLCNILRQLNIQIP